MKNHQNAPKKNHHEKVNVTTPHETVATTSTPVEAKSEAQLKGKNAKKH